MKNKKRPFYEPERSHIVVQPICLFDNVRTLSTLLLDECLNDDKCRLAAHLDPTLSYKNVLTTIVLERFAAALIFFLVRLLSVRNSCFSLLFSFLIFTLHE